MSQIDSAIAFAALAHAGQKRKYTLDPYIVHPIEVMTIVRTVSDDDDMAVAAVLHDVLEDTPVSTRELYRRFGERVSDMVLGLTEVPVEGNRAVRKAAERERLALWPAEVQTIKVADIISNNSTIIERDPKFAKTYVPECVALLNVLTRADPGLRARASQTLNIELEQSLWKRLLHL